MEGMRTNYEPLRGKPAALLLAQFFSGGMLAWGLGYWWLGQAGPALIAIAVTLAVHVASWRVKRLRGTWATALGFFATFSKIDSALAASSMGDLRLPIIVVGSLLALGYGVLIEERQRFAALVFLRRVRPRP